MKIQNIKNYNYKSQNEPSKSKTSFKGYFACPIKELHIQPDYQKEFIPFAKELEKKCKKYFDIVIQLKGRLYKSADKLKIDNDKFIVHQNASCWGQDNKLFLEDGSVLIGKSANDPNTARKLAKMLNLPKKEYHKKIAGGNIFLGKDKKGKNIALIGSDVLVGTSAQKLSRTLGIEKKNLFVVPQPDFHIDLMVRPLNFPYILVGDYKLMENNIDKNNELSELIINNLQQHAARREEYRLSDNYASPEEVIKSLKSQGLEPIRVPGIIGKNKANFMNAIVHQDKDGKLVYITNKSDFPKDLQTMFEEIFKKDLMSKAPQVKEIMFINGDKLVPTSLRLLDGESGGGVHCLSCERPNFEAWRALFNNPKS